MKKHYFLHFFLVLAALCQSPTVYADLQGAVIVIDPGHGTYTDDDRPVATISYPNLSNGRPQTELGFYESNTNLWKAEKLAEKLRAAGATVIMTREKNGVSPSLSARAAAAESNSADYFISIHSNANVDGDLINYLSLWTSTYTSAHADNVKMATAAWPFVYEAMGEDLEFRSHNSYTSPNLKTAGFGVLKHSRPAYLSEGFFHTYQPARHRALNKDYCRQEGVRYYRAIASWFKHPAETTGYIMGVVKSADKKMTRSTTLSATSWYYAADTHDQYVPLNGAVVELWQGETKLNSYTVDNNYNGIFVFEDLEPGTYQVKATCEGHTQLTQTVTVTANETVYPKLLLSEGANEPVESLDAITMKRQWDADVTDALVGKVRRTLQYEDNIIVLTVEENDARSPHIYAIDQRKIAADGTLGADAITELSTTGIVARDLTNAGDYLPISDIGITTDGKLIACNFNRTQYGSGSENVDANYKRGTLRFYKWDSLSSDPALWVSKSEGTDAVGQNYHSANRYKADVGYTMAVSGSSANCNLTVTAVTTDQTDLRYVHINVKNDAIASGIFTKSGSFSSATYLDIDAATNAPDYRLSHSPLGNQRWVFDATNTTASEFIQTSNSSTNSINGAISESLLGKKAIETHYAYYKNHHLAAAPYFADSQLKAVRICDVTSGFGNATKVVLQDDNNANAEMLLATPIAESDVQYASSTLQVNGEDLHTFLFVDYTTDSNERQLRLTKYSTTAVDTDTEGDTESGDTGDNTEGDNTGGYVDVEVTGAAIYAANLSITPNEDFTEYTLNFTSNENATAGALVLYDATTTMEAREEGTATEIGRISLSPLPVKGNNTYTITREQLTPFMTLAVQDFAWSVELTSKPVTAIKNLNITQGVSLTTAYNTVDIYPESPHFGNIYVVDYVARYRSTDASGTDNGVYVYSHDYQLQNTTPYKGGTNCLHNAKRPTVDHNGRVFIPDAGDEHVGIYLFDPANPTAEFKAFFEGTTGQKVAVNGVNGYYVVNAAGENIATSFYGIHLTRDRKNDIRLVASAEYNIQDVLTPNASQEYSTAFGCVYYRLQYDYTGVSSTVAPTGPHTLADTWKWRPSEAGKALTMNITKDPVVWYTSYHAGYFVAQAVNTGITDRMSLQFHGDNSNMTYPATYSTSDYRDATIGTMNGGGFALTHDETKLITYDCDTYLNVFDITWTSTNTPTFKKNTTYTVKANLPEGAKIRQMSFDYAGNLIVSGNGISSTVQSTTGFVAVYSFPKADNTCETPARANITVKNPQYHRTFTNAGGDNLWSNTANWSPASLPTAEHHVLIQAPCEVDIENAGAMNIHLQKGVEGKEGTLTILPTASLYVQTTIRKVEGNVESYLFNEIPLQLHDASDLVVKADATGQGVLVHADTEGNTPATVEVYGMYAESDGRGQLLAVPVVQKTQSNFSDACLKQWNEVNYQWTDLASDSSLELFKGYQLTQSTPTTYALQGNLPAATSQTITGLTYTIGHENEGLHLLGNSWTAPLQIDKFKTENFVGVEPTVYIYDYQTPDGATEAISYYKSLPISAVPAACNVINPLQGFFVVASVADATVSLEYDNLVNKTASTLDEATVSQVTAATERQEMQLRVTGNDALYCDLRIVQQADFTHDFDAGFDARKLRDDARIPYLAAASTVGDMAVLATSAFEGTYLNFARGTNADSYTFTFHYDGEANYQLEDMKANEKVDIRTGNTYLFIPSDDDSSRFRIVKAQNAPDVPTDALTVWVVDKNLYMTNPLGVRTQVSIYSVNGQLIKQVTTHEGMMHLQMPSIGVYIIQVSSELGTQILKYIM